MDDGERDPSLSEKFRIMERENQAKKEGTIFGFAAGASLMATMALAGGQSVELSAAAGMATMIVGMYGREMAPAVVQAAKERVTNGLMRAVEGVREVAAEVSALPGEALRKVAEIPGRIVASAADILEERRMAREERRQKLKEELEAARRSQIEGARREVVASWLVDNIGKAGGVDRELLLKAFGGDEQKMYQELQRAAALQSDNGDFLIANQSARRERNRQRQRPRN